MPAINEANLQRLLKRGTRKHEVPGATLAVLRNGRVTAAAAGLTNLSTGVPTTTDTVFQIGSISKIFTTTLIMQLVDEGRIDLDAPVRTYLPNFAVGDADVSRNVTVRHFLTHTSGIEGDVFGDTGRGDETVARLQTMGRFLPNLYPLGERMSYCNFGFAMLGRILEVMEGKTFDDVIRERLFKPLGLQQAMTLPEDALKYRCAIGHMPDPKRKGHWRITPWTYLSQGQKAAGSMPSMSVLDLMRFTRMHLDGGKSADGTKILSARSVAAMQRNQVKLVKDSPRGMTHWGLGWFLGNRKDGKVFGHDGATFGQYAFLRICKAKNVAVALLTNGGNAGGLFDEIETELFEPLSKIKTPRLPDADPTLKIDPAYITGRYERLGGWADVTHNGKDFYIESEVKDPDMGGGPLKKTKLVFGNRYTARYVTDDPMMVRQALNFEGEVDGKAAFMGSGGRLFPRVS